MTETELKSIITKEIYERVKKAFIWDKVKEQTNHYYTDKSGILREKRIMVRVRVVDGKPKLQVKLHKNSSSPLQICEENEYETDTVTEFIDSETTKKITGIDTDGLYRMGSAVTLRHSLKRSGSEICLDKTEYFDIVDYEVEMEYEDKMSAELLMKLTSLGVEFKESCVGKFSRFLAEYKKRS